MNLFSRKKETRTIVFPKQDSDKYPINIPDLKVEYDPTRLGKNTLSGNGNYNEHENTIKDHIRKHLSNCGYFCNSKNFDFEQTVTYYSNPEHINRYLSKIPLTKGGKTKRRSKKSKKSKKKRRTRRKGKKSRKSRK